MRDRPEGTRLIATLEEKLRESPFPVLVAADAVAMAAITADLEKDSKQNQSGHEGGQK
jgi:hypothetical protein